MLLGGIVFEGMSIWMEFLLGAFCFCALGEFSLKGLFGGGWKLFK